MADLDKLTRAFPKTAIRQRKVGGGRMLDYVEGHTVIHRLNEATSNQWDFKVLGLDRVPIGNDASLMTATVELCIAGHGCRQHIGVQMVHANGGEDLVKGAVTDALKKAATLFGVGLELYGPDYEAGEVAHQERQDAPRTTTSPPRTQHDPRDTNTPQRPTSPSSGGTAGEIVDWTAFWTAVKPLGFSKPAELEAQLGFSIKAMTPQQALDAVDAVINPDIPAPA